MEHKPPTFVQALCAGGMAGTSVDILFFPLDTLKTRLQAPQGFVKAGGFHGVYKGLGSVVVGSAPGAALFFSTYEFMKHNLPMPENLAPLTHMMSASIAETAACFVRVPVEVIKTRTQTMSFGPEGKSSWGAAKLTLRHEGLRGFFRGFGTTLMRDIPFTALQFPLYELFKREAAIVLGHQRLPPYEAALCGSVAGAISAAVTTPLDVLKTRVMLDTRVGQNKMPSLPQRARTIVAQEGAKALFSGIVPRMMWISAGGAVFLGVYEWAIQHVV
ncbi:mitochondrial carrier domain-containing protein [Schizophyllum amplum]|uniref:Mitochondrial carrier domain-containing protein n=1 Tax=Schizophyllum amplum TaxID=97359 RepID=A0A550CCM1_9AGAR|nr:mitochondrial carrier domain-containing protein [Auriculariopsis ampla]